MNTFTTKRTLVGAAAIAAAGLAAAGVAAPAMADDRVGDETSITESATSTDLFGDTGLRGVTDLLDLGPVSFDDLGNITSRAPITGGDVSNESPVVVAPGDIASDIGSGNGDIGSGNVVGSGNDVQAPIGSGNETNVDLGGVSDLVDVGDVGDVSGSVGDVTGSVGDIVGDVTGSVDGLADDITGDLDLGGLLD
ncbi:hypothetical protein [Agromyces sp. Leaf222]|uniref:hypothetical protein n=1 Tax=Agromyces sp. Leaf222 TaxID=1735688 RepID=UPI0006FA9747|nr:hypothetical protein [Agromyces sp. Leaf222]KQM80925.1 hypothetical protein ASE68_18085 [Agromyces sp. Leaf222]